MKIKHTNALRHVVVSSTVALLAVKSFAGWTFQTCINCPPLLTPPSCSDPFATWEDCGSEKWERSLPYAIQCKEFKKWTVTCSGNTEQYTTNAFTGLNTTCDIYPLQAHDSYCHPI